MLGSVSKAVPCREQDWVCGSYTDFIYLLINNCMVLSVARVV
jgi:hypothetical protein